MKRVLSFILILILLNTSYAYAQNYTPSLILRDTIYSTPATEFQLLDELEDWEEILENLYAIIPEEMIEYRIDECLVFTLSENYNSVIWHLFAFYPQDKNVIAMFVSPQYKIVDFREAIILENGDLQFDYTGLELQKYYMVILTDPIIDF